MSSPPKYGGTRDKPYPSQWMKSYLLLAGVPKSRVFILEWLESKQQKQASKSMAICVQPIHRFTLAANASINKSMRIVKLKQL